MMTLLKSLYQQIVGWIFSALMFALLVIFLVGSLGLASRYASPTIVKWWGRGMIFLSGATLQLEGAEHLQGAKARIVTYNHTSSLDIFVICAVLPTAGVHVMKRELAFVPFIGWGPWMMRYIFVDRRNRERAIASMGKAAKRIRDEKLTVFISPEGTRSRFGELLPFKMGAFHLARQSGAPIYPLVIHNAYKLWAHPQLYSHNGPLPVEILPPIDSADLTEENLRAKADQLHELYAERLLNKESNVTEKAKSWAS